MKIGTQIRNGRRDPNAKARSRSILNRYHLHSEIEELYPFQLSGGMTRRVLISTALMETPSLVIADEPTPGLDSRAVHHIMSHFREIADNGAALLLITHDLEAALSIADRIVVFYAGFTLEDAPAADFTEEQALRHPYTQALWRAMPQHKFQPIAGTQPYAEHLPEGCPFVPRCPHPKMECSGAIPYQPLAGGFVRCLYPDRREQI